MSKLTRRELFGLTAGAAAAVAVLPKAGASGEKTYTASEIANAVWQAETTPEAPKDVTITSLGDGAVVLMWPPCLNTDHYEVYRNGVLLTSTRGLKCTDRQVEPGRFYTYTITAVGHGGDYSLPSWPMTSGGSIDLPPMKILPAL